MTDLTMTRLDAAAPDFKARLAQLLAFNDATDSAIQGAVSDILAGVRARGDAAVLEYTARFDRLNAPDMAALELSQADLHAALEKLPLRLEKSLKAAAERVRVYHEKQRQESWTYTEPDGTVLGQQVTPLDRVGLYVPGGKAAYPSSVLMNAIPAKVAGREGTHHGGAHPGRGEERPGAGGGRGVRRGPGVHHRRRPGRGRPGLRHRDHPPGGQDRRPGNAYVAEAKRRVFGIVGIDMIAGPSEILVICDGKTNPDWIAMDLFSQAEHDELAQSILISPDAAFLDAVQASVRKLLPTLPRQDVISASIGNRGGLILCKDLAEAAEIANFIAPEHLELSVEDPNAMLPLIRHAGAIFMGRNTCEALGDYCAGPNHVLPTSRTARFSSPLGVYDFQKRSSLIHVSEQGAKSLGEIATALAYGEGLQAHGRSAEYRMGS
jgi:histidinol dehydrogenase